MKLTINRSDNVVIVDGRRLDIDCSGLPNNISAVQFDGERGEIEFFPDQDGDYAPNQVITSTEQFSGVITAWQSAANAIDNPPPPTLQQAIITKQGEVMRKRDQEIDGGVAFQGKRFQTRPTDRENVQGASTLALMAIVGGALPGDLRWSDPTDDFGWIAEDNSIVTMDAHTVVAFGKAVAARKSACIFYARALKDDVELCSSVEEVNAININSGWPT